LPVVATVYGLGITICHYSNMSTSTFYAPPAIIVPVARRRSVVAAPLPLYWHGAIVVDGAKYNSIEERPGYAARYPSPRSG